MKFLKLFESFDKLYNHISEDDFLDTEKRTSLDFESKLIRIIKSKLNSDYDLEVHSGNGIKHLNITKYDMSADLEIWQTSDEWFIVSILYNIETEDYLGPASVYYECDTFDGLIQLLSDKGLIKLSKR